MVVIFVQGIATYPQQTGIFAWIFMEWSVAYESVVARAAVKNDKTQGIDNGNSEW